MSETFENFEAAETEFFTNQENPLFNWNEKTFCDIFTKVGFNANFVVKDIVEKRKISQQEILNWFDSEKSAYGSFIAEKVGMAETEKIKNLLLTASKNTVFTWETKTVFFTVELGKENSQDL